MQNISRPKSFGRFVFIPPVYLHLIFEISSLIRNRFFFEFVINSQIDISKIKHRQIPRLLYNRGRKKSISMAQMLVIFYLFLTLSHFQRLLLQMCLWHRTVPKFHGSLQVHLPCLVSLFGFGNFDLYSHGCNFDLPTHWSD